MSSGCPFVSPKVIKQRSRSTLDAPAPVTAPRGEKLTRQSYSAAVRAHDIAKVHAAAAAADVADPDADDAAAAAAKAADAAVAAAKRAAADAAKRAADAAKRAAADAKEVADARLAADAAVAAAKAKRAAADAKRAAARGEERKAAKRAAAAEREAAKNHAEDRRLAKEYGTNYEAAVLESHRTSQEEDPELYAAISASEETERDESDSESDSKSKSESESESESEHGIESQHGSESESSDDTETGQAARRKKKNARKNPNRNVTRRIKKKKERQASPAFDLETQIHAALAEIGFTPKEYWQAMREVHNAVEYRDEIFQRAVEASKLAPVLLKLFKDSIGGGVPFRWQWTRKTCQYVLIQRFLPACKTYIERTCGPYWTRLDNLIDNFDNREVLEASTGYDWAVVQMAKSQDEDEAGAAHLAYEACEAGLESPSPKSPSASPSSSPKMSEQG
jgi:hypothetical protein